MASMTTEFQWNLQRYCSVHLLFYTMIGAPNATAAYVCQIAFCSLIKIKGRLAPANAGEAEVDVVVDLAQEHVIVARKIKRYIALTGMLSWAAYTVRPVTLHLLSARFAGVIQQEILRAA